MPKASQPQITVYRGWIEHGKHVWSPFVVKLETRLRFAGLKYTTEAGDVRKAPKGKIPYVELRDSAEAMPASFGDSTLIIKGLVTEGVLPEVNSKLDAVARIQDLALRALLEEKLYPYHTRERWIENYYTMRDHILWALPFPIRVIVGLLIYRKTAATLNGQGTGRFSHEETLAFRTEIWDHIAELLATSRAKAVGDGDEPFWALGGQTPTEVDASLFGFIVSVLICTAAPESNEMVRDRPVLAEYARRIHQRYFPDYETWK